MVDANASFTLTDQSDLMSESPSVYITHGSSCARCRTYPEIGAKDTSSKMVFKDL